MVKNLLEAQFRDLCSDTTSAMVGVFPKAGSIRIFQKHVLLAQKEIAQGVIEAIDYELENLSHQSSERAASQKKKERRTGGEGKKST